MSRAGPLSGLGRYAAGRALTAILVVVGALAVLCALTSLIPGNPAIVLLGPRATPEMVAALNAQMGLDRSLPVRLVIFFKNALTGDLGKDVISGTPVLDLVMAALPNTIALALTGLGLAILLGVPLGARAATNPGGLADRITAVVAVGLIATPSYVVAIFLLLLFAVRFGWFPVLGAGDAGDLLDQLHHLVLPAVAISVGWIGYIARLVRSALLEVLGEPFIRTARAYGIGERRIVYAYALKLACVPVVAILGVGLGELLGGAVFAEIIFNRPGLGSLLFDAIRTRNFPVVQGAVLVIVVLFVVTNLMVDLAYAWLDPRVGERLRGGART